MELEWAGDKLTVSHGEEISSSRVTAIIRSCQMITDYFNMILGLFDCLAAKLVNVPSDSSNILALQVMSSDFIAFLEENREKYFSVRRDYEAQE
ncbi:unnamed protein product [Strongylus vulgaris]|uniref:Uncharacterized protein n=1 Tax=Strongylus vulgaris TaxID=40348 RepID=A0A3P7L3J3_STRVU|nr:unnamed protein product [Strongylus vulgaris]